MQQNLFNENEDTRPQQLAQANISYREVGTILNKTSGLMADYDYSLNPYSGCTYCYAAFFARDNEKQDTWGYWVNVKENALSLLRKFRKKPITSKKV